MSKNRVEEVFAELKSLKGFARLEYLFKLFFSEDVLKEKGVSKDELLEYMVTTVYEENPHPYYTLHVNAKKFREAKK